MAGGERQTYNPKRSHQAQLSASVEKPKSKYQSNRERFRGQGQVKRNHRSNMGITTHFEQNALKLSMAGRGDLMSQSNADRIKRRAIFKNSNFSRSLKE